MLQKLDKASPECVSRQSRNDELIKKCVTKKRFWARDSTNYRRPPGRAIARPMNLPPNSAPVRSAPDKAAPSFSYDGSPMVFAGSPFARCEEAQNTRECLGVTGNEDRFFCPYFAIRLNASSL